MLTKASKNYRLEMVAEFVINVVDSFIQPLKPDIVISKKIFSSREARYKVLKKRDVKTAEGLMRETYSMWKNVYPPWVGRLLCPPQFNRLNQGDPVVDRTT
jgi:hypothetical protein